MKTRRWDQWGMNDEKSSGWPYLTSQRSSSRRNPASRDPLSRSWRSPRWSIRLLRARRVTRWRWTTRASLPVRLGLRPTLSCQSFVICRIAKAGGRHVAAVRGDLDGSRTGVPWLKPRGSQHDATPASPARLDLPSARSGGFVGAAGVESPLHVNVSPTITTGRFPPMPGETSHCRHRVARGRASACARPAGFALAVSLSIGIAPVNAQDGFDPALPRQVEVIRTAYGVPHIYADNLRALGYALGHLQVEDYGERVPRGLLRARGELAVREGWSALDSDFASRSSYARAVETYERLHQDTRAVYEGFASGVNRYMAQIRRLGDVAVHRARRGGALRLSSERGAGRRDSRPRFGDSGPGTTRALG